MSEQTTSDDSHAPRRPYVGLVALTLLVGLLAGIGAVLLGGSTKSRPSGAAAQSGLVGAFQGTLALPLKPAPPIVLHNYLGAPVSLAQYHGKAVFVTFLYANCPDVCPLIVSNLRVALNELGPRAGSVQVIAVSVDPRGDTAARVARFLRAHEMTGRMQYLVGSPSALAATWAAWGVGSERNAAQPELVAHSALIYGVSAAGKITTVYPATFEPSEIVHDAPVLLAR